MGLWFKKWYLFSEYQKKVIEFYSDNKELMNKMRNFVLEKQVVETLFANLRATEKETGFSQLDTPAEHCMTAAFPVLNMPKI